MQSASQCLNSRLTTAGLTNEPSPKADQEHKAPQQYTQHTTEYKPDQEKTESTAGDSSHPSERSNPIPVSPMFSFNDKRQETPPSNHGAPVLLGLTITVQTSTVMDNTMEFCGDYRFPPGRPPIPGISKPDQTESINEAFAVWAQAPSVPSAGGLEAARAELGRLFSCASYDPLPELKGNEFDSFQAQDPSVAPCDPAAFRDPEFQIHNLDVEAHDPRSAPQKGRMLSRKEVRRRLQAPGTVKVSPANQQVSDPISRSCGNLTTEARPCALNLPPPIATTALSLERRAAEAVASLRSLLVVYDTEKSARNRFVASFLNEVMALHRTVSPPDPYKFREFLANIDALQTFPALCCEASRYVAYYRLNEEQVAFAADALENRFQVSKEIMDALKQVAVPRLTPSPCPYRTELPPPSTARALVAGRPWSGIGEECKQRTAHSWAGVVVGRRSTQVRVAETMGPLLTGVATGGQLAAYPPPPLTATPMTGGEADSPLGAQLQSPPGEPPSEMRSPVPDCVPDHRVFSLPPSPLPELSEQKLALGSLQYDEPLAQVREQGTLGEAIALAKTPSGSTLSASRPRRTRRGRRGRKSPSLHPPIAVGGGGGGVDSRGVQLDSSPQELPLVECTPEGFNGLEEMLMDAIPALQTSTEQGTTVPVTGLEMAGGEALAWRRKRRRGKPRAQASGQVLTGQGEMEDVAATLSLRTEFRNRRSRRGVSILSPQAGLGVEVTRGRKGRRVVLTNELVALHSQPDIRRPPLGTRGTKGVADELARQGPVGPLSARIRSNDHSRDSERNHQKEGRVTDRQSRSDTAWNAQSWTARSKRGELMVRQLVRGIETVVPTEVLEAQNPIFSLGALEASISEASELMGRADLGTRESLEGALAESREQNRPVSEEDQNTDRCGVRLRDCATTGQSDNTIEMSTRASTLALASVEVRLMSSGKSLTVEVTEGDWSVMEALGLGMHPDLVVGLALRRQAGPSQKQGYRPIPTIRLVRHDAQEIPKDTWPASWEGLVEHVQQGGYFRTIATLRGGMDQDT